MKQKFQNSFLLACLLFLATYSVGFAQDITEKDKTEQEEVLKEDPRNAAANFVLGAYYYNQALAPHQETTKMNLVDYMKDGKAFENKKEVLMKKSLPYLENYYAITRNGDPRAKEVLKSVYQHLGMIRMQRISNEDLEKQLQEKLAKVEFKAVK